jgi:hypothetical protein
MLYLLSEQLNSGKNVENFQFAQILYARFRMIRVHSVTGSRSVFVTSQTGSHC